MDGADNVQPQAIDSDAMDAGELVAASEDARNARDFDASLAIRRVLAAREPGNPWAHLELANDLISLGAHDEAHAAAEAATRIAPDHPDVRFVLGRIARSRGDRAMALDVHLAGAAHDPSNIWFLIEAAVDQLALGSVVEAEATYGRVLAIEPGQFHALLGLGHCARARGDRALSLDRYMAARTSHPDHVWPVIEMATDLLALGEPARAASVYGQALAVEPENVGVLLGLGACARALGDHAGSLAHHEAALALEPGNARLAALAGADCLALGDVAGAQRAFERALALDPTHPDALEGLARCTDAGTTPAPGALSPQARTSAQTSTGEPPADASLKAEDQGSAFEQPGSGAPGPGGVQGQRPWPSSEPPAEPHPTVLAATDPATVPDAPTAIAMGARLLAVGDAEGAIRFYERALALDPQDVEAFFGLGRAARALGDRAASLARFEAGRAAAPDNVWLVLEAAADREALGDIEGARRTYEQALLLAPCIGQALFGLARCARARGDRAASLAHHEAALRAEPDGNVWAHVEIGADLLALREVDQARAAYAQACAIAPDNVQALFGLGYCARTQGDHRESLARFKAADAVAPGNHWAAIEIGVDLLAVGDGERARDAFERALSIEPGSVQALLGRIRSASVEGDIAGAAALAEEAATTVPHEPWVHLELATNLRALGRHDAAAIACRRAAELMPDRVEPLLGLAACDRLRGDRAAALAHAEAAHRLAPGAAEPLAAMGAELRALARDDQAARAYEAALARQPGHAEALFGRAALARQRADREETLALLREARDRNPGLARTYLELAAELRALGRFDEARETVRDALERFGPDDLYLTIELAAVERAAGDLDAARAHLERAAAAHPHRAAVALTEAATVERELGRPDAAAALLARAAELDPGNATLLVRRGEQAMASRDPARAFGFFREAWERYPSDPGAALSAVEAMIELGQTAAAERTLDALERRFPAAAAWIRRSRVALLRRTGEWPRARTLAVAAAEAAPHDFHMALERYGLEKLVGTWADAERALALIPARGRGEIAQTLRLAGDWAEEARADRGAAREAYLRAEALDPGSPDIQWDLCRLAMQELDLERARHHLKRYAAMTAGWARARGGAPHPSQSHYGQILDELVLDADAVAALRPHADRPPEARMEAALSYVAANGESTAAALFATVAAREIAGALGRRGDGRDTSPVPRRIAQYWNDPEPPPDIARFTGEWRDRSPGWTHTRWSDAEARAFLASRHGTAAAAAFDRLDEPAKKADLLRLAILHAEGGLYLDADDRPLAPADALLDGASALILYQEDFGTIGNNMLAAVAGHSVITRAFAQALEAVLRGDRDVVWLSTGPGLITRVFVGWLAEAGSAWRERLGEVTVLPRRDLFACMAVHCHAGYKRTSRHWSNSTFARGKLRMPLPSAGTQNLEPINSAPRQLMRGRSLA